MQKKKIRLLLGFSVIVVRNSNKIWILNKPVEDFFIPSNQQNSLKRQLATGCHWSIHIKTC